MLSLSSLERIAIKSIMSGCSDAEICDYFSFNEFRNAGDKADAYIVSESAFICNTDFFLPRKSKLIVISTFGGDLESIGNNNQCNSNSQFRIIGRNSGYSEISEKIMSLLKANPASEEERGELSAREKDVLKQLSAGMTNKEIADILCISVNTVITHRKNISAKLGIRSASGLSLYALMNGLI